MFYWTAAMLGGGIALLFSLPTLRGASAPSRPASRSPAGVALGSVEMAPGDGRATDAAVARLERMIRALDAAPTRR
jgi:hypothetical protein